MSKWPGCPVVACANDLCAERCQAMIDLVNRLHLIRNHLRTGAVGQREVWEEWLAEAIDELDQLTGSKNALQVEIERLKAGQDWQRGEIERLRLMCADAIKHLEGAEAEIEPLKLALIKATAAIAQLKKIQDGTERRESEYLALVEKHATDAENLRKQIGSAEQMVYDSGFRLGKAYKEIARLQESNGAMANLVRRLQAERHTTKRMLKDILDKHGYSGWDAART